MFRGLLVAKDNGDCKKCRGLCCRYFGLPIDTPETKGDFDDIRWYLLHKGTEVYVSDGDWYLNVKNTCKHLNPDYSCGILAQNIREKSPRRPAHKRGRI